MSSKDKVDNKTLLVVDELRTYFGEGDNAVRAVDGVSFSIQRGETFALLGESGCGKSITALSLLQLIPMPPGRIVSGRVLLDGEDLLQYSERQMRSIRGNRIAMIFQEPMTSLNPVLSVGEQIIETLEQHTDYRGKQARDRAIELLGLVGIPQADHRIDDYPHQLSGGMKQRVMIAVALACEPELLIADEPTTALDVTIQAQVLGLLKDLQKRTGMAILLITHDLGVVSDNVDHLAVMYAGQIVEQADRQSFFSNPRHPYSKKLFAAVPDRNKRNQRLAVIQGSVPALNRAFEACRFANRCDYAWDVCHRITPKWLTQDGAGVLCHLYDPDITDKPEAASTQSATLEQVQAPATHAGEALLQVKDLRVHFPIEKGLLKRTVGYVYAVDGVDIHIDKGRTLALVGESGCGKTTVGKAILQLHRPTRGSVLFDGEEMTQLSGASLRRRRRDIQIIFQDPFSSMNPRMQVGDIIAEGMSAQKVGENVGARQRRVESLLEQVGLPADARQRYPHEFSGGQRQRICVARALAVDPKLIICDEPTSALDVSVQAQILNLLKELQSKLALSYLFITHNLSVVEYLAHEVAVMYLGRIVEYGTVDAVLNDPKHPYTQALLSAVPTFDEAQKREVIHLEGEIPSPINPPRGCHFHPRCPHAMPICKQTYPGVTEMPDRQVKCYLYSDTKENAANE